MNKPRYSKKDAELFLIENKISTLKELKETVGTEVDMTVFRILKSLSSRSSYSHGGRFYTLDSIAEFDDHRLWCHQSVCFSRYGNLLSTLEHFATKSKAGYFASELEKLLHVEVKSPLLKLFKKGSIGRKKISGAYLYCSPVPAIRKKQLLSHQVQVTAATDFSDEVKAAIILFVSMLDEQQRRLYAGLEALKIGHGGDLQIAEFLGLHPQTVAKGRRELQKHDVQFDRIRVEGAGRKQVEKKPRR
ncbi:MAG TPA: hypothetical protein ENH40_02285 [Nitrospirae bacterium]|nr:hypothetical protein [Nitrospirota bacterium]